MSFSAACKKWITCKILKRIAISLLKKFGTSDNLIIHVISTCFRVRNSRVHLYLQLNQIYSQQNAFVERILLLAGQNYTKKQQLQVGA